MGLEDRDWYREEQAKRQGAYYDKTTDRYRRKPPPTDWHWATQILVWLMVLGVAFLLFRQFEHMPRQKKPTPSDVPSASVATTPAPLQPRPAAAPARPAEAPPARYNEPRPPTTHPQSAFATVYLCQSYGGGKFWSSAHCQQSNALIDRMETVPSNLPFDQQVALASQQRDTALALSSPPPVRQTAPAWAPPSNPKATCDALEAEIQHLDSMARAPQSARTQDWITGERKRARDAQFRLRC